MRTTSIITLMEAARTLKRRFTSTKLHDAISQKALIFILAAVRTLNITKLSLVCCQNLITLYKCSCYVPLQLPMCSPLLPHGLWSRLRLLSAGYRRPIPQGRRNRSVKLITHLHLMPMLRLHGSLPPFPKKDRVKVLNVYRKSLPSVITMRGPILVHNRKSFKLKL
jgi:hypothetical protein